MTRLFSKKLFAIALFLSLATAVLHLSSQFFTRYQPIGMYQERAGFDSMMGVKNSVPMPGDEISMPPIYWEQDNALDVVDRVYSTSSYSQLVVRDVSSYIERLRSAILSQDGRVLSSSIEKYGRYKVGSISARVPSEKVSSVLTTLKEGVVTVVTESTSIQDETGQYVNLADKITALEEQIAQLEADLVSTESVVLKQKLQRLQTQLRQLQSSQDVVTENVQYARIDVSVSDGVRFFDPSARPSVGELLDSGWGMLAALWSFTWNVVLLTALYLLVWLPVTFVAVIVANALKTK